MDTYSTRMQAGTQAGRFAICFRVYRSFPFHAIRIRTPCSHAPSFIPCSFVFDALHSILPMLQIPYSMPHAGSPPCRPSILTKTLGAMMPALVMWAVVPAVVPLAASRHHPPGLARCQTSPTARLSSPRCERMLWRDSSGARARSRTTASMPLRATSTRACGRGLRWPGRMRTPTRLARGWLGRCRYSWQAVHPKCSLIWPRCTHR